MTEQKLGKNYSKFVNALVFIFPIVINSVKVAGDIVLFILAMMGIYIAISQRLSPFIIKDIKVFSYLTTGYFLAVCLSVLLSGKALELAHYIPRDFHFLFAPFIALAFYKAEINSNYLLTGVKVGLIVLGIIIINQLLTGHPRDMARPSGAMNTIVFSSLTVSMFFVVLVYFQQESFKHKIFTLLSLFSGFLLIVLSGSRGAWVSFLLLLVVYLYFLYKKQTKSNKTLNFFVVLIIAIALSSTVIFSQRVNDRLDQAYIGISNWFSVEKSFSSIGKRLEMYSTGIDNIDDVPFFGHGYRTSNLVLGKSTSNYIEKFISSQNHLHNAYLTNFYNGGIIFLGALLLLLFVPLRIFIKAMSQNPDNPVFIAGALLTLGFAYHGMFNVLFGDVFINAFYVFFLAILLHLTAKSTKIS